MFVIHGNFSSSPTERLCNNLTQFYAPKKNSFFHKKCYNGELFNFTKSYLEFEKNVILMNSFAKKAAIVPPIFKVAEFYAHFSDFIIVRFPYKIPLKPCTNLPDFEKTLQLFAPIKHKSLIELSGDCVDFNMNTAQYEILSYNQAILKCALKNSKTFFDDNSYSSYFTYLGSFGEPHLVYTEDTLSISKKHNMIKELGFLGISWKDVALMADGNWESLKGAYNKKAQS